MCEWNFHAIENQDAEHDNDEMCMVWVEGWHININALMISFLNDDKFMIQ